MAKQDKPFNATTRELIEKYTTPGKKIELPIERDRKIVGRFKFTATTAEELDESIWPTRVRDTLAAMQDLIGLARRGEVKPVELRRMKLYQVTTDELRALVEDIMMIRLGKDANFSFALERGFFELLTREVDALNAKGVIRAKVRFYKPKDVEAGEFPLYERITFRFDGQFEVQVIDRFQYAGL